MSDDDHDCLDELMTHHESLRDPILSRLRVRFLDDWTTEGSFVYVTRPLTRRAQKRSARRAVTDRKRLYTLPGGEPKINEQIASRAILMF